MPLEARIFHSSENTRLPVGCEGFTTYCRERKVRVLLCSALGRREGERWRNSLASDVSSNARLPYIGILCPELHGRAQRD